jgi:hypothetical protein
MIYRPTITIDKLARATRALAKLSLPRPVVAREYPTLALVRLGAYEQPMLRRAV